MRGSQAFLQRLVESLEGAGIAYMVSGSLGSTFFGEHRSTNDIDLVISATEEQLGAFLEALGDDFYVSPAAARQALRSRSVFNVIQPEAGLKADLIIRKDRPFSVEEFGRRKRVEMLGVQLFMASAEDIILSKLEWAKAGESDRQLRDALGVTLIQWKNLDFEYLRRWSRQLNVGKLLEQLLEEAQRQLPPQ